jgi:hypothetical protein
MCAWKRQLQDQAARTFDADVGRDAEAAHGWEMEGGFLPNHSGSAKSRVTHWHCEWRRMRANIALYRGLLLTRYFNISKSKLQCLIPLLYKSGKRQERGIGRELSVIRESALFEAHYYTDRYADVRDSGLDPATHYFLHGSVEGRNPGPFFSTTEYLKCNPDVAAAGINPVLHYELYGRREGRRLLDPPPSHSESYQAQGLMPAAESVSSDCDSHHALPLQIRQEAEVLVQVSNLSELLGPWKDNEFGRSFVIKPPTMVEACDMRGRIKGEAAGSPVPDWVHGGRLDRGLAIHRIRNAIHVPTYGAVIAPDGSVLHQSVEEALYGTPTLAALPNVTLSDGRPVMVVPSEIASFSRATIFCAAGGLLNYGHFILDCLTALLAIEQEGLTSDYLPLFPSYLKNWHRELLGRMNPNGRLVEVSEPLIHVQDLLYASPMAHYLVYPG